MKSDTICSPINESMQFKQNQYMSTYNKYIYIFDKGKAFQNFPCRPCMHDSFTYKQITIIAYS